MTWESNGLFIWRYLFDEVKKDNKRIEFEKTENTLVFTVDVD